MWKNWLLFMIPVLCSGFVSAQPQQLHWDKNLGGIQSDVPASFFQMPDSGFVLLLYSRSDSGFLKSEPNRDSTLATGDFWLIHLDPSGNKLWDKTIGGLGDDVPSVLVVLPDGFLLAGTSSSGIGAQKTDTLRGVSDFWVVRLDKTGNIMWDKTIGGPLLDVLTSAVSSYQNSFILGGYTLSGPGGDKTSPAKGGFDFWYVKLDSTGNFVNEETFGSIGSENCFSLTADPNGDVYLCGYSDSPNVLDKSQPSRGGYDYWVVKADTLGRKIWDRTIGGSADEYCFTSCPYGLPGNGLLIGGDSFSPVGFEKTSGSRGANDYWLVHLSTNGVVVWDETYGNNDFDEMNRIQPADNGRYLLSGESYSVAGNEKSENNLGVEQIWVLLVDSAGQKLWDKTFFTNGHDEYCQAIPVFGDCVVGLNLTVADTGGYRSWMNYGLGDVWMAKLCNAPLGVKEPALTNRVEAYPVPAGAQLYLRFTGPVEGSMLLMDQTGRILRSWSTIQQEVDLSALTSGWYQILIRFDDGSFDVIPFLHF